MNTGRRWFLKALIALPFVPLASKVAAAIELPTLVELVPTRGTLHGRLSISDIIAQTIESRQRQIADNVSKNNVLLAMLRTSAERERAANAVMTEEQRQASELRELRYHAKRKRDEHRLLDDDGWLVPRYAWSRGQRLDMHAGSGYSRWRRD